MQSIASQLSAAFGPILPGPAGAFLKPVEPLVRKLLIPDRLASRVDHAYHGASSLPLPERLLESLDIRYTAAPDPALKVPRTGPVIVVANHPFGMLEGILVPALLRRVRDDIRIVANSVLAAIPEFSELVIPVSLSAGTETRRSNAAPLRRALQWLGKGGLLVIFPAGEVSHLNWKERPIADPDWNPAASGLARLAKCPVVPIFFEGANSAAFQLSGTIHPRLRTVSLARELSNKQGRHISVRIGSPISPAALRAVGDDGEASEYLRYRTYLLGCRLHGAPAHASLAHRQAPVESQAPPAAMESEISSLSPLLSAGEFSVYSAEACRIPTVLQEIGRLRELTFRAAGEGTGKSLDLDRYDRHYRHLFLWNRERGELVGSYRLGVTGDILPMHGVEGLYTNSLFRFDPRLFPLLGPAIELGRSFIRTEYQRQFSPLLLLWKGICQYVSRRPGCPTLFGAVSISNEYTRPSRDHIVSFLKSRTSDELARYVKPRRKYRADPRAAWQARAVQRFVKDVEQLSEPVSDLEPDGKGVPILVKQYLKLGGVTLGVNVDPAFSSVVDALIVVDVRRTSPAILNRYMGPEAAARFREYHSLKQS
jgi:putative hemolysin